CVYYFFFFSSRRRHTRSKRDWSSDVCSSDLDTLMDDSLHKSKQYYLLLHMWSIFLSPLEKNAKVYNLHNYEKIDCSSQHSNCQLYLLIYFSCHQAWANDDTLYLFPLTKLAFYLDQIEEIFYFQASILHQ